MELLRAVSLTIRPALLLFDLVLVALSTADVPDARTFFRRAMEELHQEPRLARRGRIEVARGDLDASREDMPAAVREVVAELGLLLEEERARLEEMPLTSG